jgi:hypothetical protein
MGIRGIHPIDPNCMDIRAFTFSKPKNLRHEDHGDASPQFLLFRFGFLPETLIERHFTLLFESNKPNALSH